MDSIKLKIIVSPFSHEIHSCLEASLEFEFLKPKPHVQKKYDSSWFGPDGTYRLCRFCPTVIN